MAIKVNLILYKRMNLVRCRTAAEMHINLLIVNSWIGPRLLVPRMDLLVLYNTVLLCWHKKMIIPFPLPISELLCIQLLLSVLHRADCTYYLVRLVQVIYSEKKNSFKVISFKCLIQQTLTYWIHINCTITPNQTVS